MKFWQNGQKAKEKSVKEQNQILPGISEITTNFFGISEIRTPVRPPPKSENDQKDPFLLLILALGY